MRKQMKEVGGYVPPLEDCPPDLTEFPINVLTAFEIFGMLPDISVPRMDGKIFYQGKNLSTIPLLFDLHYVTSRDDKLEILEYINILDSQARKDLNK